MRYFYIFFVIMLTLDLIEGETVKFRCDYNYSSMSNGWFKYHEYPVTWPVARLKCLKEGAALASPTTEELLNDMERIIAQKGQIFTGIHATVAQGFFHSLEGTRLSNLKLKWYLHEPNNLKNRESCITLNGKSELADSSCYETRSYICFRPASRETVVNECGTVDTEYHFDRRTNKCYKFHTVPRNFSRAFLVCTAEGGHLAIINDATEHLVLKSIFAKFPKTNMKGDMEKDEAYIGFHSWDEKGDWRTIEGQTLWEAGYNKFKLGQPDNKWPGQSCGTLNRVGELGDYYCEGLPAPFICEKSPTYPAVCEVPNFMRSKKRKQLKQKQSQPKKRQLQSKKKKLQQKTKLSKRKSNKYKQHF